MDITMPIMAFVAAIILAVILAMILIPVLRKLKVGQNIITEYGPTWHKDKQGTPTMGGVIFAIAVVISFLLFGFVYYINGGDMAQVSQGVLPSSGLTSLIVAFLFGLIGFIDDFLKKIKKINAGLGEMQKTVLSMLIAIGFIVYIVIKNNGRTDIAIPFLNLRLELSYFYYIFALIVILGTTNAVNFTDGVDGLCTSVTIPVMVFFAVTAALKGAMELSVLSAAAAGALAGYLVFSWHPAKVMMGDTGSFFLGGLIVGIAFSLDIPVIIVVVGIIYFIEIMTVIIQRTYYKITKGKRIFKMTPIHHQFEMDGWSEVKICMVFTSVTIVACVLALLFG